MIGREIEAKELNDRYESQDAEFVAVYGRRRVGKTYLIDEVFQDRITFRHAGLSPVENSQAGTMKKQLEQFYYSLLQHGMKKSHCPKDWLEAFFMLETLLQEKDDGSRILVFLDELPWMDTPRSGFISGLEGFWNNWCCFRHNVMLVVCGSATSWMQNKLIHNHGGLYGRLTWSIHLEPFTLKESEQFLKSRGVQFSRFDIAQSYMILGGIPYYLRYFEPGLSLAQNIDKLFYTRQAKLQDEFNLLFASLFTDAEYMQAIVKLLSEKNAGFTRRQIAQSLELSEGSRLTEGLHALTVSGFIVHYVPFGCSKREIHYQLSDPFCIYWLRFGNKRDTLNSSYWQSIQETPGYYAWRGLAFEKLCFQHIDWIKQALGISGIRTTASAWSKRPDDQEGTQMDMLIERADNVINLCEMKFTDRAFSVDKEYDLVLRRRTNLLREKISPKVSVHPILMTPFGLTYNEYSGDFVKVIILDDFFK